MRFVTRRRGTDSGRTRFWYVIDTLGVMPHWMFGDEPTEEGNRLLAEEAAEMLNRAHEECGECGGEGGHTNWCSRRP